MRTLVSRRTRANVVQTDWQRSSNNFQKQLFLGRKKFLCKGRPHGGILWIVRNNLKIKDFVILSEQISKIVIELNQYQEFTIYGNWLGYDSRNRASTLSSFQTILTLLER